MIAFKKMDALPPSDIGVPKMVASAFEIPKSALRLLKF